MLISSVDYQILFALGFREFNSGLNYFILFLINQLYNLIFSENTNIFVTIMTYYSITLKKTCRENFVDQLKKKKL